MYELIGVLGVCGGGVKLGNMKLEDFSFPNAVSV